MWVSLYVVAVVCSLWQLGLAVVGLVGRVPGGDYWPGRVLAIVPAHNEEKVVAGTVQSLLDAGCFVVVIADACTDGTVGVVERLGVDCLPVVCNNKGAALNAFLDNCVDWLFYDYLTVVDCGTVVGPQYEFAVCSALSRYAVAQSSIRPVGRLGLVGSWYAWLAGYQHVVAVGRAWLGLPAWIGGSGFCWRSDERVRFDERCLVEDLELSLRLHSKGDRVGYFVGEVYDEKPDSLAVSVRQRVRWARGGWWLLFHGRFLSWRLDDVITVLGPLVTLLCGVFLAVGVREGAGLWVLGWCFLYAVVGWAGLVRLGDGSHIRWSSVVMIPLMSVVESVISLVGLVTVGSHRWLHTPHVVGADGGDASMTASVHTQSGDEV